MTVVNATPVNSECINQNPLFVTVGLIKCVHLFTSSRAPSRLYPQAWAPLPAVLDDRSSSSRWRWPYYVWFTTLQKKIFFKKEKKYSTIESWRPVFCLDYNNIKKHANTSSYIFFFFLSNLFFIQFRMFYFVCICNFQRRNVFCCIDFVKIYKTQNSLEYFQILIFKWSRLLRIIQVR